MPKLDRFNKHNGRRKCIHPILGQTICEFYTSSNTQHAKNERMSTITWLILSFNKWLMEKRLPWWKNTCDLFIFPSFETWELIIDFKNMQGLFEFLNVDKTPKKTLEWFQCVGNGKLHAQCGLSCNMRCYLDLLFYFIGLQWSNNP